MSRPYQITRHSANGVVRLALAGEFDVAGHDDVWHAILGALREDITELVIDLSGVTFFDSGAVGILLAGRNAAGRAGRIYRVIDPPPVVRRVLETNGLLQLLTEPAAPSAAPTSPGPA